MEITVKTKELQDALAMAAATTTRGGSTIPIVSQVFLESDGSAAVIRATDAERSFSTAISAEIKKKGKANVKFQLFQGVVNLLTTETVRLSVNKSNRLEILAGKSTSRIPIDATEYPAMPKVEGETVEIPASSFASAIRVIMPALDKESGFVFLSARPGVIRLAGLSTMGMHRFCVTEISAVAPEDFKLAIAMESAIAVRKLLADHDGHAIIRTSPNSTVIECGETSLHFMNREARAPQFDVILNMPRSQSFTTTSQELIGALKRSINFFEAAKKDGVPAVQFDFKDEQVRVSLGSDLGEASDFIEAKVADQPPKFKVNGSYMTGFLSELGGTIEVRYNGEHDNVWVKPGSAEYPLMIVMPIH